MRAQLEGDNDDARDFCRAKNALNNKNIRESCECIHEYPTNICKLNECIHESIELMHEYQASVFMNNSKICMNHVDQIVDHMNAPMNIQK